MISATLGTLTYSRLNHSKYMEDISPINHLHSQPSNAVNQPFQISRHFWRYFFTVILLKVDYSHYCRGIPRKPEVSSSFIFWIFDKTRTTNMQISALIEGM